MTSTSTQPAKGHGHHEHQHEDRCDDTVTVHVNNKKVFLHPGRYDVATFKKLANVPQAEELEQLIDNKLHPIPDNATIHIKGCEVFIAHVREGGSS